MKKSIIFLLCALSLVLYNAHMAIAMKRSYSDNSTELPNSKKQKKLEITLTNMPAEIYINIIEQLIISSWPKFKQLSRDLTSLRIVCQKLHDTQVKRMLYLYSSVLKKMNGHDITKQVSLTNQDYADYMPISPQMLWRVMFKTTMPYRLWPFMFGRSFYQTGLYDMKESKEYGERIYKGEYKNIAELKKFIAHGAVLNIMDSNGHTRLYTAIEKGLHDEAKVLLAAGANPNVQSRVYYYTPLFLVVHNHFDASLIQAFINADTDLDYQNDEYEPILHTLSGDTEHAQECKELVRSLIEAGVNINLQNGPGETALMVAAINNNTDIMHILLRAGARCDLKDEDNETAFDRCLHLRDRHNDCTEAVKVLEDYLMNDFQ